MAITDYKVTATPLTVGVGSAADSLTGSSPAEIAANKAIFDAYPDAIKEKHDDLIDYLDTMPMSFQSTAAASTANKGSFSGWVPIGGIVNLSMENGNTAENPTITIDGVSHTITNMPKIAMVSTSVAQVYRLKKTSSNTLIYINLPEYVCEYGTSGAGWIYERRSSGRASCYITRQAGSQTFSASGGVYVSPDITANFPSGLFNAIPVMTGSAVIATSSVAWISDQSPTQASGIYAIVKTTSASADLYHTVKYEGTWR